MKIEWRGEFDPLLLLLRSAPNPKASAIVARIFHEEFVIPLADKLKGENTELRAGLIASYIIGVATMRVVLNSPTLKDGDSNKISSLLKGALQTSIDDASEIASL